MDGGGGRGGKKDLFFFFCYVFMGHRMTMPFWREKRKRGEQLGCKDGSGEENREGWEGWKDG